MYSCFTNKKEIKIEGYSGNWDMVVFKLKLTARSMILYIGTLRYSFLWRGQESLEISALIKHLTSITGNCLIAGVAPQREGDTELMANETAAVNQINSLFLKHEVCTIFHRP